MPTIKNLFHKSLDVESRVQAYEEYCVRLPSGYAYKE